MKIRWSWFFVGDAFLQRLSPLMKDVISLGKSFDGGGELMEES